MFIRRFFIFAFLISALSSTATAENTECMTDKAQNISRYVAMDDATAKALNWSGPNAVGARPQIAPVEPDNGNRTPGSFRYAYFYSNHTTAFYTSHVDPQRASIQYTDRHPRACGATQ